MSDMESTDSVQQLAQEWNDIADVDPMWAVLSQPDKKHSNWTPEEFYATGDSEIDRAISLVEGYGLTPRFDDALDFGCGMGRLTAALGKRFASVTGVDISTSMVEQARAGTADRTNLTFVANERSDLSVFPDGSFDFVYTARVLQHMPTAEMAMQYIAEFIRILRPGGIACFHVPAKVGAARRLASRRRLAVPLRAIGVSSDWLYRRLGLHSMHLVAVTETQVARTLATAGAREIGHRPDGFEERINNPGYFYVAVKP